MLSFLEERFPLEVAYGATGGPCFNTEISESAGGVEHRNIRYPTARHKYNLVTAIKSEQDLEIVLRFFKVVKGRAIGFRFKDWVDWYAQNQTLGTAEPNKREYQLIKTYSVGFKDEIRTIKKPVPGSVSVYVNGKRSLVCSVDYATGIVKFHKQLKRGSIITADFEFDVPVRFDTDSLSTSLDDYGVYSLQELPLIEIVTE